MEGIVETTPLFFLLINMYDPTIHIIPILISFYVCHGSGASGDGNPAEFPCTLLMWGSNNAKCAMILAWQAMLAVSCDGDWTLFGRTWRTSQAYGHFGYL